jgi:hypothetical protein
MDTVRVGIVYRPLRMAWGVHSGDWPSFESAIRISHTAWGGRFNPVVFVDRPAEAKQLVETFRADLIWPVGDREDTKAFPANYPHLIDPLYGDLFHKGGDDPGRSQLLDIHNAASHGFGTPQWKLIEEEGVYLYEWDADDPVAKALLLQFGGYPSPAEIGIDYRKLLGDAKLLRVERIDRDAPIPAAVLDHPTIGFLTRHGLTRHYSVRSHWNYHGFFVGDASSTEDLAEFWNLRAADLQLLFVDLRHFHRYATLIPHYAERLRGRLAHLRDHERCIAVWSRPETMVEAQALFTGMEIIACRLDPMLWNGLSLRPPMMMLGEESALGVLTRERGKPRVSFALNDKPFCDDAWFHSQHLVASISTIGGLHDDDDHTFHPPYVPELNEFLARTMHFDYSKLRVETERIGIIIDATDHDAFLNALPTAQLFETVFELAGIHAKLSGSGLITKQLLSRLGGVSNARVFKVPGVRRLLKTYGPTAAFTKKSALQIIGETDPRRPDAKFADHHDLFIEPRPLDTKLTPQMVFAYLVEKGLFRIGAELTCPTCRLASWIPLDVLKQMTTCELCGSDFDATRQLVDGVYHYRRTGVLGLEKHSQGATVLEQLTRSIRGPGRDAVYAPSYDLRPKPGVDVPSCEIDFGLIIPRRFPDKTTVVLGECKDGRRIDQTDVDNMRRIADALPPHRFEVFIAFAKLAAFTDVEIAMVRGLNDRYRQRAILLSPRELEPYYMYRGVKDAGGRDIHSVSAKDLAAATAVRYLQQLNADNESEH